MAIEKIALIHWWHYYGKYPYTFAELKEFEKVIDEYGAERVMDAATASYICDDGSPTIMLGSIRRGVVKELFESLPDISKMEEKERENYNNQRKILEDQILESMHK